MGDYLVIANCLQVEINQVAAVKNIMHEQYLILDKPLFYPFAIGTEIYLLEQKQFFIQKTGRADAANALYLKINHEKSLELAVGVNELKAESFEAGLLITLSAGSVNFTKTSYVYLPHA